jgi:hypothetical protein
MALDTLRCPLCGAGVFYRHGEGRMAFFLLAGGGRAILQEGGETIIPPEEEIFCASCAWHGTWPELERKQKGPRTS